MGKRIAIAIAATIIIGNSYAQQLIWTAPIAINSGADTDSSHDTTPRVARGPDGELAVTWITQSRTGTTTITKSRHSDVLVSFSSDAGTTWTPSLRISDPELHNSEPDITAGTAGQFLLAWNSGDIFSNYRLHTVRILNGQAANSSMTTVPFTADEMGFLSPRILSTGGNEIVAKSSHNTSQPVKPVAGYLLSRSNLSTLWSPTAQVDSPPLSHNYKTLSGQPVGDDAANVVVPFIRDYEESFSTYRKQVVVMTSDNSGSTWTNQGAVSPANIPADFAVVATDKNGLWMLLWLEEDSSPLYGSVAGENIFIQKSTNNGTSWTVPQTITVPPNLIKTLSVASLATNGSGHWLTTFQGQNDAGNGYGSDGDIFYTWSIDDGATWTPIATINDNPASDTAIDAAPQGIYLGENRWAVIWSRAESGSDADIVIATAPGQISKIGDWQLYQ